MSTKRINRFIELSKKYKDVSVDGKHVEIVCDNFVSRCPKCVFYDPNINKVNGCAFYNQNSKESPEQNIEHNIKKLTYLSELLDEDILK